MAPTPEVVPPALSLDALTIEEELPPLQTRYNFLGQSYVDLPKEFTADWSIRKHVSMWFEYWYISILAFLYERIGKMIMEKGY